MLKIKNQKSKIKNQKSKIKKHITGLRIMRYLIRFLWAILVLFLLTFTVKNTETIVLRYYFNYEWQAPLIFDIVIFSCYWCSSRYFMLCKYNL